MDEQTAITGVTTVISTTLPQEIYDILKRMTVTPVTTVSSRWLYEDDEHRLDAGNYANEAFNALRLIKEGPFPSAKLGSLVREIFHPNRIKRMWAAAGEEGLPFLGGTEILHLNPLWEKSLSKSRTNVKNLQLEKGWVLVTRSGTIGRVALVNNTLSRFLVSEHVIRIVPNEETKSGYLYAFLASNIGQTLIKRKTYGLAVPEIEPHHIAALDVPLIPIEQQTDINNAIMLAYSLRDEANKLLGAADDLIYQLLSLPHFDESLVSYLSATTSSAIEMPHPRAFQLNLSELEGRFDASYHVPAAKLAVKLMRQGKYPLTPLGSMVGKIIIPSRFKRNYVDEAHGVPFLQGTHLPQIRPYDLKYISRDNTKNLQQWRIHTGWVLVTRSGTIGRIGVVSSLQDRWAASEHLLRIVPQDGMAHPGYIAAVLMTPYGQHQLTSKIYGGVVDELTEADTSSILLPNAPAEIQRQIGEKVIKAYEKRDEANQIEAAAIKRLEGLLNPSPERENQTMPDNKLPQEQETKTRKNQPISLHPLSFGEALAALLQTPPPPKETTQPAKDSPKSEPK